mmetsp:Transcript_20939/g.34590  ORF Transcript_20939/g.34590 Transcript_20939/m.34590 type:complete len:406 (+) Transcript_20939:294-1511(+)|eukprot:CAMPEP_0119027076 /NCGR_PEP_ID=MMETSP1176-20130426/36515_1 /TAXON_ID=265551 /ORGANISM="Synedropsis recta cf, Strain CCMP1620" /LENGTH=405 /DNA_ID=CAMNT_0006982913 /DNA_START=228 /DNA_END=1445 /DNA_ORIENTATION=-
MNHPRSRASLQAEGSMIVGGGIAGLATAIALNNVAGVRNVSILEASSHEEFNDTSLGAALFLGPNGLKALRAIGGNKLMNQVIESGTRITGNEVTMPGQTMVIPDTAEQKTGLPNVMVRWGVMRSILQNHLSDGVKVSNGKTVTAEDFLKYPSFAESAPMLVAADGIRSSFAPMVRGDTISNLKDNGRTNIKAVAPTEMFDHCGKTKASFAPDGSVACFAGPAGEGYTYWAISIADSVVAAEGGTTTRFVDGTEDLSIVKEKLLETLSTKKAFAFAIELITDTESDNFFVGRSEESLEIGPSLCQDKVVLIGDAAHAMAASYGQCPNFALEDAATLAWCIRDSKKELEDAMDDYSNARVDRCAEMAERASVRLSKATKGENTEDVWDFIFDWKSPMSASDMQTVG